MRPLFALLSLAGLSWATTLDELARHVEQVESIRAIKDATATFAQLAQFGRYGDMAAMFAPEGVLLWGDLAITGPEAIEQWLRSDAGGMNGVQPGSMDTLVIATPLINLAADGQTAKGRFNGWRFQGDGGGETRIQGGIYENEYALVGGRWKISRLRYYPLYEGNYAEGWANIGRANLGKPPPYHYTPDEAGIPIPPASGPAPATNATLADLQDRIDTLNDEDQVRNLQHAYGYYVDRRMWKDVLDLFANNAGVYTIDGFGSYKSTNDIVKGHTEWMGPQGLTQGVLNEHLIFDMVVKVRSAGDSAAAFAPSVSNASAPEHERIADARGIEIALIGDSANGTAFWQFNVFQNTYVKRMGVWQMLNMTISPLVVANYSSGWGYGSLLPKATTEPRFLPYERKPTASAPGPAAPVISLDSLSELQRRLNRSAAYDGAENVSNAYGFYIDFIDGRGCTAMADIHAREANKESPFAGFYQTRTRVREACTSFYGTGETTSRAGISFHWRPQPVIHVSSDGRSASLRARLLQPATDKTPGGQLRGGMYHDQMAIEDGIWRLWSVTIDEFYWGVSNWTAGWAGVAPRAPDAPNPAPRDLIKQYPPDLLLTEIGHPRETGFQGGVGRFIAWPEILHMWFHYRNPVSGAPPEDSYWPGCVPCKHRPEWKLEAHGWQEPPTGP